MRGRVTSGRGDLTRWMERYRGAYERVAGQRLVPGSLNLVLAEAWVMEAPDLRLEAEEVGVGMNFLKCRVADADCFLVRTDKNNSGRGDHPQTVVELVSAVHLRTALGLRDGDEVFVMLDP